MRFGELLDHAMRADWAANYVNYKRAKDQIEDKADVPTFKEFIVAECNKVERFYAAKLEEVKLQSAELEKFMSSKSSAGTVGAIVKVSWEHTEDLRGLYDYCRLCAEGIRKSLKKYDKTFKTANPELQKVYLETLKTQYVFFNYKSNLKDLLRTCASFWDNDGASAADKDSEGFLKTLPDEFPLSEQIEDLRNKDGLDESDDDDEEKKDKKDKKKDKKSKKDVQLDEVVPVAGTEEEKDMDFERDFVKQRESKPQWRKALADYKTLNSILKKLAIVAGKTNAFSAITSLSMGEHPDKAYGASPEILHEGKPFKEVDWFKLVDKEIDVVTRTTNAEIVRVRSELSALRDACEAWAKEMKNKTQEQTGQRARTMLARMAKHEALAKQCGEDFLALEKFVNLNYQAFEKLLKNHDKLMSATPCHQFYMTKLRNQEWIRNDFSDIFVALSDCHSLLRQDDSGKANEDAKQDFVRNTKKYWVPVENVSAIKHLVLQHLPVFRMWTGTGDSQLVNSVYFDNRQMQLYHGRMDKTPGAIALRLRWYGTEIKTVFVERKTHLDSWTGNVSVKERFTLPENLVVPFLNGSYTVNEYADDMKHKGKKDADIEAACKLFSQIARAIHSKQLGPTVRTQYMRTAFQIPFDSSVRISLDTNLCMVREDVCGYASTITERWRRDERIPVKASEHTHFPHAVLEVKLQGDVENPPQWVKDMLESGMVTEVYKFSKFIHGGAVLLTELVAAAPYWIDDVSIRDSVNASAPTSANKDKSAILGTAAKAPKKKRRDDDESSLTFSENLEVTQQINEDDEAGAGHPLLGQMRPSKVTTARGGTDFLGRSVRRDMSGATSEECTCCGLFPVSSALPRKVPVRIEPKTFFANERTFLSWLHMSVTLGSISSALTVFSEDDTAHGAAMQIMSLFLTLVAGMFTVYAMYIFNIRRAAIRKREDAGLDGVALPIILASTLVLSLIGVLVTNLAAESGGASPPHPKPTPAPDGLETVQAVMEVFSELADQGYRASPMLPPSLRPA